MSQDSKEWVRLASAWLVFCDHGDAGSDRRRQFLNLRRPAAGETPAETEERLRLLEFWERKIKYEFVWRIYDGDFDAVGVDVSNALSNSEQPISRYLFDPTIESFSIQWDENRLSVVGKTIVGVRIAPSGARLGRIDVEASPTVPPVVEATPLAQDDFPSEPGATSFEKFRAEAVLYLYRTYPAFESVKLERRIAMMVDYVDTNHPEIDTSWGFDRSSYYKTVDNLRRAGLLTSKNVQQ